MPTFVAVCPALSARIVLLAGETAPSNRTLAPVTVAGQLVRTIVNRVAAAVEPVAVKLEEATFPSVTVWLAEAVSTVQAVSRMLPTKLIVPSTALTEGDSGNITRYPVKHSDLMFI